MILRICATASRGVRIVVLIVELQRFSEFSDLAECRGRTDIQERT